MSRTISIAMCTYNGEKYLVEQLNSIITQTMQPDEIVICDDCSKDRSVEVAKLILGNWQGEVKIIKNEHNLGFKRNFQKAIGLCSGDIIFLCDQDDVWHKDKIAKLMEVFKTDDKAIMAFHDVKIVDEKLTVLGTSFWKQLQFVPDAFINNDYDILYRSNVVQGASCAFKRELFECAKPFCEEAHHDEWLALVAQAKGNLVPVGERLADYRQTGNNALGAGDSRLIAKFHRWVKLVKESSQRHIEELNRRYCVLREFSHRYNALSLLGERYLLFLKKRVEQKLHINIIEYMQLECTPWNGIKEFVKDNLANFMLR